MTIHSWAGIGIGSDKAENYVRKFKYNKNFEQIKKRWDRTDVLIIDETCMLSIPFGGMQLIVSGDFAQLPPVPAQLSQVKIPAMFAFDAQSWDRSIGKPVMLTKVFRQKDQAFVDMLNAIRLGKLSNQTINMLKNLSRKVEYTDKIGPTELYPLRSQADNANTTRLNMLKSDKMTYIAHDVPGYDADDNPLTMEYATKLLDRLLAPISLTLKIGAQVMLIKNISIDRRQVNGSVGLVTRYMTVQEASRERTPTTIPELMRSDHEKDQKMDFSRAHEDPTKWPLVKFADYSTLLCVDREFTVNGPNDRIEATRVQVPLILAWALSIHKSQGQTLERVKIDLSGAFENGQAYVALSRATSMDTLEVIGFTPLKIQAHPRVLRWYGTVGAMSVEEKRIQASEPKNRPTEVIIISDDESD